MDGRLWRIRAGRLKAMGRIVTTIDTEAAGPVEVWTGSPRHTLIHIGGTRDEPAMSLTTSEAESFAVAIMAARTRLLGWGQAALDQDLILPSPDTEAVEALE